MIRTGKKFEASLRQRMKVRARTFRVFGRPGTEYLGFEVWCPDCKRGRVGIRRTTVGAYRLALTHMAFTHRDADARDRLQAERRAESARLAAQAAEVHDD